VTLTAQDMVDRAIELRPVLQAKAAEFESNREVSKDVIEEMQQARLFDTIAPKRWGGLGLPLAAQVRVSEELARGDASVSWVHYILSFGSWMVSLLPDAGQEEVFAEGVPRVGGIGGPPGTARRVDDGYVINGKWGFASGCEHAHWCFLVATPDDVEAISGMPPPQVAVVVPMSDVSIEDTWFVAGMCGTGSNTLVAQDVLVPDRRILAVDPEGGSASANRTPTEEPSDYWPFWPTITGTATGPLVGMAQAVFDLIKAGVSKRGITYTSYERQTDSHIVLRDLAEAAIKIESARLLLHRCAAQVDELGVERRKMSMLERAQIRGEVAYVSRLLRETVDSLMSIGGASAFAQSNVLQRYWRDLGMISRHAFLSTNPGLEVYGRALTDQWPIGPM
jgi:alkylation response protein AidB-like acyl-CoA dehydrogenase